MWPFPLAAPSFLLFGPVALLLPSHWVALSTQDQFLIASLFGQMPCPESWEPTAFWDSPLHLVISQSEGFSFYWPKPHVTYCVWFLLWSLCVSLIVSFLSCCSVCVMSTVGLFMSFLHLALQCFHTLIYLPTTPEA